MQQFTLKFSFAFFLYCFATMNLSAQDNKILIEKFTATWCGWCPNGDLLMDSLINEDPRFILVDLHWGATDPLSIPNGNTIIDEISNGSPSASFNREKIDGFFNVGIPWSDWESIFAADDFSGIIPFTVSSETAFDTESRELTINATANSLGILNGDYRINAYVVQENFTAPTDFQYHQVNFFEGVADHPLGEAGDPIVGHTFHNVVRAILGGPWGQEGVIPSPTQTKSYSTTFTYTVPEEWDENELFVVVMVQEYDQDKNKRDIINSFKEDLNFSAEPVDTTNVNPEDTTEMNPGDTLANGINDLELMNEWQLYPNPAKDFVYIQGESQIDLVEIWNIKGQKEMVHQNNNLNAIPVSELATGMYLMRIESREGTAWMRFLKE